MKLALEEQDILIHWICLDWAQQCHLVRGDCQDVDGWRAGVFGGGVCGAFEAVAVDVETFDCAWDAAVAAGRVGSFGDFSDGSCAGGF
jgi:hypothetical protein